MKNTIKKKMKGFFGKSKWEAKLVWSHWWGGGGGEWWWSLLEVCVKPLNPYGISENWKGHSGWYGMDEGEG